MAHTMMVIRQALAVLQKDLLVEWRAPSRFTGVVFFAFALMLVVAFASADTAAMQRQAGGMIWLGLLLASTRSLDQSYAAEVEQDSLEGLLLWPVHPTALFIGKALSNAALLLAAACVLAPLAIAMFNASIYAPLWQFAAFMVLGCGAIAAPGTLLGAITVRARGSSVLLPLLLLPLLAPALLASARGTAIVMSANQSGSPTAWLALVAVFNLIYWPLSGVLYSRVVEGGST